MVNGEHPKTSSQSFLSKRSHKKISITVNELLAANAELQEQVRNLMGGVDKPKGTGVGGCRRMRREGSGEEDGGVSNMGG